MNRAIFAVDAGGTHSRARLIGPGGQVLAQALAGPCNPSTDLPRAAASLHALWAACAGGLEPAEATLAIGGAGLYVAPIRAAFLAAVPAFGRNVVMSDGYAALIGAGGGRPAALIVAGTGVAGHRLFADGTSIQRDGWGWIAGDRGSGTWIGRRALRHAMTVLDGIAPADALAEAVIAALNARDRRAGAWLVGLGPDRLAALVPLVLANPCPASEAILDAAAGWLAALARTLHLAPDAALFMAGGLADIMRDRVGHVLGHDVAKPQADAIAGCHLVASGAAPEERSAD